MRRSILSAWAALIVAAALPAALSGTTGPPVADPKAYVKGITISTHGGGRDWGGDEIVPTLSEIRAIGANWVSTHPYARIGADGSVGWRELDPAAPPAYIVRPIHEAQAQGLSICIKPHIAYWGSPFSWRGEIEFDTDEKWQRFWREYSAWILDMAKASRGADAFVVGTELDKTLHFETEWRQLIAQVRQVTNAPLTYAANWTDYERVPFWDALDVIGIQAYFPITDHPDPNDEALRLGWQKLMNRLSLFSQMHNRKILFTELGYNQSHNAPVEPWEYHVDPGTEALQLACLRTALQAIEDEPTVVGSLLWKWFPHPRPIGRNFQLATPDIKRMLSGLWLERN
jgi:hypothetical protein